MAGKGDRYSRGLDYFEVALIKGMVERGYPRDLIMSYVGRPGRTLSPAVISDVTSGEREKSVQPATEKELDDFIAFRKSEVSPGGHNAILDPVSASRVRDAVLRDDGVHGLFPDHENLTLEYKEEFPKDRSAKAKFCKTMAALANTRGGYIIVGVNDRREVIGLSKPAISTAEWNAISDTLSRTFAPQVQWDRAIVDILGKTVAAVYVYEAAKKPIISTRDCTSEIDGGRIYHRYMGASRPIDAPELIAMLDERDARVARLAAKIATDH